MVSGLLQALAGLLVLVAKKNFDLGKGFFGGLGSLAFTKPLEQPVDLRPVPGGQIPLQIAFLVNKTALDQCLWKDLQQSVLESLRAVENGQGMSQPLLKL